MRTIRDKIDGKLEVDDSVALHGMVTGNVIVTGTLELYGMCCADLIVERGGTVRLRGMVVGDVVNRSGSLLVSGMIVGRLVEEAGATTVERDAVISGRRR